MKKYLLLYICLSLSFLSLFLPATLKPNPQTFQLDNVNFFEIIKSQLPAISFIVIAILFVLLAYFKVKQLINLSLGILFGAYLQFILTYINWTYLDNDFFGVYLYGFWLHISFTILTFVILLLQLRPSKNDIV
ncbi:hypothetical protein ACWN83_03030 [Pseudolactococcus plantarum]|uniref:hypothetical protein n=1 Tax=Pseudolactococcus plantarum TaxID=1365 RepID=UPI00083738C7|nr:hypothetical protein [Lactococcus plantarum]HCN74052.1 hypothetical protein [Lactococcus sp.]